MGNFGPPSNETRKKISLALKGRKQSEEHIKNRSLALKGRVGSWNGKHHSLEHRIKNSIGHKGEKSHLWKGGITPINKRIRQGLNFRLWREQVFRRDNYTCSECGIKSGLGKAIYLNPHHIKSFSEFPELRFSLENGITLCEDCHKKTENYGGKNHAK